MDSQELETKSLLLTWTVFWVSIGSSTTEILSQQFHPNSHPSKLLETKLKMLDKKLRAQPRRHGLKSKELSIIRSCWMRLTNPIWILTTSTKELKCGMSQARRLSTNAKVNSRIVPVPLRLPNWMLMTIRWVATIRLLATPFPKIGPWND